MIYNRIIKVLLVIIVVAIPLFSDSHLRFTPYDLGKIILLYSLVMGLLTVWFVKSISTTP